MNTEIAFRNFCTAIRLKSNEKFDPVFHEIAKTLNREYYESDSETEHLFYVGSIGRKTAVNNVSDVDLLYEMPRNDLSRFQNHDGNGASDLLQEVKQVLQSRYSRTKIRGDGQVVVLDREDYTIELVPGFRETDNRFTYPDTHDGGSWPKTDPFPEQQACSKIAKETNDNFIHLCNLLRVWKNEQGFSFKGLLIDTLVADFFDENPSHRNNDFADYANLLVAIFHHLSNEDPDQAYWHALGSNQQIDGDKPERFVKKAKVAEKTLSDALSSGNLESALIELFGRVFSSTQTAKSSSEPRALGEQFPEELFSMYLCEQLEIDCEVTQNGYRPYFLRDFLRGKLTRNLAQNKQLRFFVKEPYPQGDCDIYWKVRNRGAEAVRRNCERGAIKRGKREQIEHTNFTGDHYVECYLVRNGTCTARAHIPVPINVSIQDVEHRLS